MVPELGGTPKGVPAAVSSADRRAIALVPAPTGGSAGDVGEDPDHRIPDRRAVVLDDAERVAAGKGDETGGGSEAEVAVPPLADEGFGALGQGRDVEPTAVDALDAHDAPVGLDGPEADELAGGTERRVGEAPPHGLGAVVGSARSDELRAAIDSPGASPASSKNEGVDRRPRSPVTGSSRGSHCSGS